MFSYSKQDKQATLYDSVTKLDDKAPFFWVLSLLGTCCPKQEAYVCQTSNYFDPVHGKMWIPKMTPYI